MIPAERIWGQLLPAIAEQCGAGRYLLLGDGGGDAASLLRRDGIPVEGHDTDAPAPGIYETVVVLARVDEAGGAAEVLGRQVQPHSISSLVVMAVSERPLQRLRQDMENGLFRHGYRRHTRYFRLVEFATAHLDQAVVVIPLQRMGTPFDDDLCSLTRLAVTRDLHMDMLRETGSRADAHMQRYQFASRWIAHGTTVVDAACGMGYGTAILADNSPGARFVGIDGSAFAVQYASAVYRNTATREDVLFTQGELPVALAEYRSDSVDVIVSFETLEHLDAPDLFLREAFRMLRPGGRIIVSVPNNWGDETGRDPSPHHKRVYTWKDLRELLSPFILECRWRQIADGYRDPSGAYVPHRPVFEQSDLQEPDEPPSEWWVVVAMKSPETGLTVPYTEAIHRGAADAGTLLSFAGSYRNPWLVHAMVEMPHRLSNPRELTQLARRVYLGSPEGSADQGAALAVLGYRLLEATGDAGSVSSVLAQIDRFVSGAEQTPHARRWQVSLLYLAGRLSVALGDAEPAIDYFSRCASLGGVAITPTLSTKSIDAMLWLGRIRWLRGERDAARRHWRMGIEEAMRSMRSDWREFHGDLESPLLFSMNDAVEILDKAVQCADLLNASSIGGRLAATELMRVSRSSLRGALRHAEVVVRELRNDLDGERAALAAMEAAKAFAESLALQRLDEIFALEQRYAAMEAAKAFAESLALQRLDDIYALEKRYELMEQAKTHAEVLAIHRLRVAEALRKRLAARDTEPG